MIHFSSVCGLQTINESRAIEGLVSVFFGLVCHPLRTDIEVSGTVAKGSMVPPHSGFVIIGE